MNQEEKKEFDKCVKAIKRLLIEEKKQKQNWKEYKKRN